jgi:hypothetical protein
MPGIGTVKFDVLAPLVKPHHIKVFEFSPSMPEAMARSGIQHIKNLWGPE